MSYESQPSKDWTETERWVWDRIAAGQVADLGFRDREGQPCAEAHGPEGDFDPWTDHGWTDRRRIRSSFLQTILTDKALTDLTPFGGVRIRGALVDDASINLEHARLARPFWLATSRVLVPVLARSLRIDGELSFEASLVARDVQIYHSEIREE